jgi:hypothetical protein
VNGGPIFLGGLAFTGKTPLRIALSAHPRLVLTRHTALWVRYHGRYGDLADARNLDRCLAAMASDPAVAVLALDRQRIEREFRAGPATYAHLLELVHRHHAERLGKQRWGEQVGRFEHHADQVLTAYAGAQMVHMVRDPRTWLGAVTATRRHRPGRLTREAARWRDSADLAVRNSRRYGSRYLVVRYEALRGDPDPTLHAVAAFLGEDLHPAMISALAAVDIDGPRHRAVVAPGHQRRVLDVIERHAAKQARGLGYELRAQAAG